MKPILPRLLVAGLALLALVPPASAQTATWTGSALTTIQDWNDGSLWDTGAPPNSATAVAVINNPAVAPGFPNGAIQISSATVDLAELRLTTSVAAAADSWAQRVIAVAPFALPPAGSMLNFRGAGITTANVAGADPRYIVGVGIGSQIHFYNTASISGTNVSIGFEGANSGLSGSVQFHDQSSAGSASIYMHGSGSGSVAFHDQSTAASAYIETDTLTFADQSSAGSSWLLTYAFGSTILFQDQSNAGQAAITLSRYGQVTFAGQASAGTATVSCSLESGGVVVREQADVSGLTVKSILVPGSTAVGGALDISQAASGVTLRGLDGGIRVTLGTNTLTLGTAGGDQALSGVISGSGGLVLDTGRVVNVTRADNTYTGATIVRSGTLNLAAGRVSPTTITAGARLTGAGTVAGNLVNAGTILPGNSTGTIKVDGNFSQGTTGALGIEIISPADLDQLVVSGTAALGGTLNLTGSGALPSAGSATFKFISAGTLTGRFDSVTIASGLVPAPGAARSAQLVYSATSASYQITQLPFAGFGGTSPAALALGAHVDATLAGSTGDYRNLIAGLNTLPTAAGVGTALEALSPDRYSVLAGNAFVSASARRAATDRRLAALRADGSRGNSGLFFEAGTRSAVFPAEGSAAAARSRVDRGTAGGTWQREAVSLGLTLTVEGGTVALDENGSTDRLKGFVPELFFQYDTGRLFMNASVARSSDHHDLRRRIIYPSQDLTASARVSGSRLDFAVAAGCAFPAGGWTVTPVAGLLASSFKVNDFAEAGAAGANLAIDGWSNRSLRSQAGLEVTRTARSFNPRLAVRWLHEFEEDRSFTARFAGATGGGYRASGHPAETDLVEASLAVSGQLGRGATGTLALGGAWGRESRLTSDLSASLGWRF